MKFKFLTLFMLLGMFAMATPVSAEKHKDAKHENQSASGSSAATSDSSSTTSNASKSTDDKTKEGVSEAVIDVFKSAVCTFANNLSKAFTGANQSPPSSCNSICIAATNEVFPGCLAQCIEGLNAMSSASLPSGISGLISTVQDAQTTLCAACKVPYLGCSSSNSTIDTTCGIVCCPFTATASTGQTCASDVGGTCGQGNFPTTCTSAADNNRKGGI